MAETCFRTLITGPELYYHRFRAGRVLLKAPEVPILCTAQMKKLRSGRDEVTGPRSQVATGRPCLISGH